MSTPERWDIVLKVLDGPLAGMGEQVFRGPVVRIGANPGPGGLVLNGYRGLDARQCVITAYTGGSVSVAPVGNNQVRVAPHANVDWRDIDPIRGPEYLSDGCALHLGPVGRGATLEFVTCRRLGQWQRGDLASEVADVPSHAAVPAAFDARAVGKVEASNAPFWFLGCTSVMATFTATALVLIGAFAYLRRDVVALGPEEEGYEFYESVDIQKVDTKLFEGLQKPFWTFVMAPNAEAAGPTRTGLDRPENWDDRLLTYVTASVEQHVRAWSVFRRLDAVKSEYAQVTRLLRARGLPEVFAAIPYQESRYRSDLTSKVCAHGWWQLMPEVALRAQKLGGIDIDVRDCRIRGSQVRWSPTLLAPPPTRRAEYVRDGDCLIDRCEVDGRADLERSTQAALYLLEQAYTNDVLRRSGAAVQLTILSHNAGLDDAPWGQGKRSNVLPAYQRWVAEVGEERGPTFYGTQILCRTHDDPTWCGSAFAPETQHYGYNIIAQHFLAVCYYAQNYADDPAFAPWVGHTARDGYCRQFKIPSRDEVRRGGSR